MSGHASSPKNEASARRRPQQRSLDTRERLVEAALQVFASHGFEGATTREIARRAGVALAALPYHFTTKEALWKAAADRIFGLLGDTFRRRLEGLEGVDHTHAAAADAARLRALPGRAPGAAPLHDPGGHRPELRASSGWSRRTSGPLYDAIRTMVEAAQRDGMAPIGRPEHLHYMLIGAASSVYALAAEFELLTGEHPSDEALVAEHVAMLERLFFPAPPVRAARTR